jgi:two-component system response regulator HydG
MKPRVLVVEDQPRLLDLLTRGPGKDAFECTAKATAQDALDALRRDPVDVVVTDVALLGMDGLQLCERVVANRPDIPVVVVTESARMETAVAAIRAGAHDLVTEPFDSHSLVLTVTRAAQHRALREEVKLLRKAVADTRQFEEMIGASPAMRDLYELLDSVVDSDATVLVTGETGTGKELVVRALHRRGKRRTGPFVAINCAGLPETLLESELFGHARGAFTDAKVDREGLFLRARGGTLFLDEIGDMSPSMQAKLLRAMQERVVRPVGSDHEIPFDARVVSATNRDLLSAVEEGRFRQDLLFRINVINIELPPLRARGSDVLLLAQHFLDEFATHSGKTVGQLPVEVAQRLLSYSWPGNVRELRNCVEHGVAVARHERLTVDDLPERVRHYRHSHVIVAGWDPAELAPMEEVEKRYVMRVMEAVGGNKSLAARVLGFDRKTLYNKLEKYGLQEDRSRRGGARERTVGKPST